MEITQLNKALAEAMAARTRQENLTRRLKAVEAELAKLRPEVTQLQSDLTQEEQDVERLKKGGLIGLWYDLIGRRERQLAKEEEEAALARLQHAEAVERLQTLEAERSELITQIAALDQLVDQVEGLLTQKRHLIRSQFPTAADQLLTFDEEERRLEALEVELSEAKAAGSRAAAALRRMEDSLESARRLGAWDAWTKGGILVDLAKHDRLDEAERWAGEVHETLRIFQRELRDVDAALQAPSIGIDAWDRGFDIWFDNLWTDWSILRKIEEALDQARSTGSQLGRLISRLERQIDEATVSLEQVQAERERYLTGFGQA